MPKLNLDKDFVQRLNTINLSKSRSDLKSEIKPKPKPKFKITDDTTPYIPDVPKIIKKESTEPPQINKEQITELNNIDKKIEEEQIQLAKLSIHNITDTQMMWDSFDDSIKKIVLSEIIDKYYMYKIWKINTSSFVLGFLLALIIILVLIIICIFIIN